MLRAFYIVAALALLANALWMLAAPGSWFLGLPAGLPDTGPFNAHLVRDLGVSFAVMGVALACCARGPARGYPVHLGVTAWFVGHSLVHVGDLLGGRLPHRHWWLDAPFTFVPALLLVVLALPGVRRRLAEAHPHG